MKKRILLIVVLLLVIIQFIRPARNKSEGISENHISKKYTVPSEVATILDQACNDCHSNNTEYPWYSNIQPVGWWLQNHVNEGKHELNFSEFLSYPPKKQHHKLEETIEMVNEKAMPLPSYIWMHHNAELDSTQRKQLLSWAEQLMNQIATEYQLPKEK